MEKIPPGQRRRKSPGKSQEQRVKKVPRTLRGEELKKSEAKEDGRESKNASDSEVVPQISFSCEVNRGVRCWWFGSGEILERKGKRDNFSSSFERASSKIGLTLPFMPTERAGIQFPTLHSRSSIPYSQSSTKQ